VEYETNHKSRAYLLYKIVFDKTTQIIVPGPDTYNFSQ